MSLFTIDESKCKKDGFCAAECPVKIINFTDKTRVPAPIEGAEDLCIRCGHCVAVCPHAALAHSEMTPAECAPVRDELRISPEQAEQFLRHRRSIRNYRESAVGRETLERLIDMTRHAPSGHNTQLAEWLVVGDRNDVRKYAGMTVDWMKYMIKEQPAVVSGLHLDKIIAAWEAGMDLVCRNAPHLIAAHGPASNPMTRDSCTIALSYLELAARAIDLGACWAGYFSIAAAFWPPLKKALALPEGNGVFGSLMIGYPKYRYHRIPLRNEPKIVWR